MYKENNCQGFIAFGGETAWMQSAFLQPDLLSRIEKIEARLSAAGL